MTDLFKFVEEQAIAHGETIEDSTKPKAAPTSAPQSQKNAETPPQPSPKTSSAAKFQAEEAHSSKEEIYSVTQLSNHLRNIIEDNFYNVAIEGEISRVNFHSSGHIYFDIKDDRSVINAVIWRGDAARLKYQPEHGMQAILRGKITTYPARSNYQIQVKSLEPAGLGSLMQMLEERKAKLTAEGLFDESRKKPLPFMPKTIGIITSPTGAVIQDMLHRISDRCPTHIQLWPTPVQGEGAAEKIAAAIKGFNNLPNPPQLLIVARGGGSLEDLWPFNEEIVVRAAAASNIPLISGVGHEPDTTLIDYAADRRAPTPSAAAEMAVPVISDLANTITYHLSRLNQAALRTITDRKQRLDFLNRCLPNLSRLIVQEKQRLDDRTTYLNRSIKTTLAQHRQKLENLSKLLAANSPQAPLKRGYAFVTDESGKAINTAKTVAKNVTLNFQDGSRNATLNEE